MNMQIKLSNLLQDYFYQRLINQRDASQRTISSYRDSFKLLIEFMKNEVGIKIDNLKLSDINSKLVVNFLDYLEVKRNNSVRSRNARLAAIRSFLQYAALKAPAELPTIEQVLAIPLKQFDRPQVGYLSRHEIDTIINTPNDRSWSGLRDCVLFATLYNTGARVSEIINVRVCDVDISRSKSILLHGEGRKERTIPLWKSTLDLLKNWIQKNHATNDDMLFQNRQGDKLTRSGVENRLKLAVAAASKKVPTLKNKNVSPHVIRHTTAMHLLQSGVDLSVIALWLGHESITTTHHYIEADLSMKEKALNKLAESNIKVKRYKANDKLLTFLDSLCN